MKQTLGHGNTVSELRPERPACVGMAVLQETKAENPGKDKLLAPGQLDAPHNGHWEEEYQEVGCCAQLAFLPRSPAASGV